MSYIPHTHDEKQSMLSAIGVSHVDELFNSIPAKIFNHEIDLPEPMSEMELVEYMDMLACQNQQIRHLFLGGGSYQHFIPKAVTELVHRSEFYTAYTPYQPEMSQGMLQAIFEYQTVIARITGMDVSNASLYDGATALYEASVMAMDHTKRREILFETSVHPHYREVLNTYAAATNFTIKSIPYSNGVATSLLPSSVTDLTAAVVVQYPDFFGRIGDLSAIKQACESKKALLILVVNPLLSVVLKSPRQLGADICVGDAQPLGLPLSYGGPYVGFIACTSDLTRRLPGRLVGETVDTKGRRGFVLTLQAREQHIKRERASSNICSNQALCALQVLIYVSLMGKVGLERAATLSIQNAHETVEFLCKIPGIKLLFDSPFCYEFSIRLPIKASKFLASAPSDLAPGLDLGCWHPELDHCVLTAITECSSRESLSRLLSFYRTAFDK